MNSNQFFPIFLTPKHELKLFVAMANESAEVPFKSSMAQGSETIRKRRLVMTYGLET